MLGLGLSSTRQETQDAYVYTYIDVYTCIYVYTDIYIYIFIFIYMYAWFDVLTRHEHGDIPLVPVRPVCRMACCTAQKFYQICPMRHPKRSQRQQELTLIDPNTRSLHNSSRARGLPANLGLSVSGFRLRTRSSTAEALGCKAALGPKTCVASACQGHPTPKVDPTQHVTTMDPAD